MAEETPEEEAAANKAWVRSIVQWIAFAVMFVTVGSAFQMLRRGQLNPDDSPGFFTALLVGAWIVGACILVAVVLGTLWLVVRVVRSAWKG